MFERLAAMPVIVVLLDVWYGLLLNVLQTLQAPNDSAPDILSTVPDGAFNWLQVATNAGMVLTITFALVTLLQLNRSQSRGQFHPIGAFRSLGLLLTLAFSLPALYGLVMAVLNVLQGASVVSLEHMRYVITALCMTWCAVLCLIRLMLHVKRRKVTPL